MKAWLSQQAAALAAAWRRLLATPLNSLLSLLVMAIALTLPGLGYVLLDNLRELGDKAAGVQQISVFMELGASKKDVAEIERRLPAAGLAKWTFVSREEALQRLQKSEGMAEIVASLPRNPLPDAFILEPRNIEPKALEALRNSVASWPRVAHAQLDSAWVKRFDAFLRLGKIILWLLAALFAAGLVAVTFNTIRLQVMAQSAEIEVARLIGATDVFIRRPFSYYGALQGMLGGLAAALLVTGIMHWLAEPVGELLALYGSDFSLIGLRGPAGSVLVLIGGALGWLGAQLSVRLSLRKFD